MGFNYSVTLVKALERPHGRDYRCDRSTEVNPAQLAEKQKTHNIIECPARVRGQSAGHDDEGEGSSSVS